MESLIFLPDSLMSGGMSSHGGSSFVAETRQSHFRGFFRRTGSGLLNESGVPKFCEPCTSSVNFCRGTRTICCDVISELSNSVIPAQARIQCIASPDIAQSTRSFIPPEFPADSRPFQVDRCFNTTPNMSFSNARIFFSIPAESFRCENSLCF